MAKNGKKDKSQPKRDKSVSSSNKKKPKSRPKRTIQYTTVSPSVSTWVTPGRLVSDFFKDNRLRNQRVSIKFGKDNLEKITFKFDVVDETGFKLEPKELSGNDYLSYLAERKLGHSTNQELDSWNAMRNKINNRLGNFTVTKPAIFGSKAKATILQSLTSFERAVLHLSQKDWSAADTEKLNSEWQGHGKETYQTRLKVLENLVSGASDERPKFSVTENATVRVKDLAIKVRKEIAVVQPTPISDGS